MSSNHMTPRTFLAKEIRAARAAKGMSTASLAKAVFVSESLVRAWEAGRRVPKAGADGKPGVLERLEDVLETGGWLAKVLRDLVNVAVPLEWFGRWPEIEGKASSLWSVETTVIPGLLQTENYATPILRAARNRADIDEMIDSRLERQQVLTKDDAPVFVSLVLESVLGNMVGDAQVMAEQLNNVAQLAERENIIVQIIPQRAPSCAVLIAPFVIASIDGEGDVAYVDNQLNGEVMEDVEEVARLRHMFDALRADAMNRADSLEYIRRMADKWNS